MSNWKALLGRYSITIPDNIIKELKWDTGDDVEMEIIDGDLRIRKVKLQSDNKT